MTESNRHIVVVDDEPDVREMVAEYLLLQGYAVSQAEGGQALRAIMRDRPVDLVILDLAMPGETGFDVARYLRTCGPVGIIMLTANSSTIDRVVGLEIGADDYVVKPFDLRELLARVRAVLRRAHEHRPDPAATLGREVRVGRCLFNVDARTLHTLDGEAVALTASEADLLEAFTSNPGRVLSRDRLLELTEKETETYDRAIDSRIKRLRRKVEVDAASPVAIKTAHGSGYVFRPA